MSLCDFGPHTQVLNCQSVASNQTNLRHQLGMVFEMLHNPNTSRMMSAYRFVHGGTHLGEQFAAALHIVTSA